jgi:hypothetical protein
MQGTKKIKNRPGLSYPAAFFACALTFAQGRFAALAIAARPAADRTRFFTPLISRFIAPPNAFASLRIGCYAWQTVPV